MATSTAEQDELQQALVEAFQTLVNQPGEGAKTERLEAAIDPLMKSAIIAFADVMGGGMQQSKAVRKLIFDGVQYNLAKMRRKA